MKKLTLLLVITLLALSAAPSAMACWRCKPFHGFSCTVYATGYQLCEESIDGCSFSGACPGAVAAETPLATDFTVASVERLDQPNANAAVQLSQLDSNQAPQQTASLAR
jgi:hypothetical protein